MFPNSLYIISFKITYRFHGDSGRKLLRRFKMKCIACGTDLLRIEHQARSADEAQTVMVTCPKCPLSLAKLDINKVPPQPHIHLRRFDRKKEKNIIINDDECKRLYYILIEGIPIRDNININIEAKCFNCISPTGTLYRQYSKSPWNNAAITEIGRKQIAPRTSLLTLGALDGTSETTDEYTDFKFLTKRLSSGRTIYLINKNNRISYLIQSSDDTMTMISKILYEAYIDDLHPKSLMDCIDRVSLGRLSNLSSRAYDMARVDENDHLFSTKPDGERIWISRIGMVWFYSRRHLSHEIIGWEIDPMVTWEQISSSGPIIDTEMMISHSPIVIDVLADIDLEIDKIKKDPEEVLHRFRELSIIFRYLSKIHIRGLFNNLHDAEEYRSSVSYPTDGIVALAKTGMDMYKIKSIKSIELRIMDNGDLVTEDNIALFHIPDNKLYDIGSIVELRVKIHGNKVDVYDSLPRPDKLKANSSDVVKTIVMSAFNNVSDNVVRTLLWRWSNELRLQLYDRAQSSSPGKRIILDIGSGDGQASEAYTRSDDCSYILIEPDEDKCKRLRRRLHPVLPYSKEARSILPVLNSLKRGRIKYFILNMSLDEVLQDKNVVRELSDSVKCCIATFSSQYIVDAMPMMMHMNIRFIGCCYMYDNVNVDGSIIDFGGINMKRINEDQAEVKWGKDRVYNEPAITLSDIPIGLDIIDASEIVEPQIPHDMGEVLNACDHVKVMISRWR